MLKTFTLPQLCILPCPPLSLSQKRERRGRGGEYIKGKEFVIYIYYILKTPFTFYILPFRPSPSLSSEREGWGEDRGKYTKLRGAASRNAGAPLVFIIYNESIIYIYILRPKKRTPLCFSPPIYFITGSREGFVCIQKIGETQRGWGPPPNYFLYFPRSSPKRAGKGSI